MDPGTKSAFLSAHVDHEEKLLKVNLSYPRTARGVLGPQASSGMYRRLRTGGIRRQSAISEDICGVLGRVPVPQDRWCPKTRCGVMGR